MAKTFYIDRSKKQPDFNYLTYVNITENLNKIRASIKSCTTCKQLMCLRPFVQSFFYNVKYVGLTGFVAIYLMDEWEKKYTELEKWYDMPLCFLNITILNYKKAEPPLYSY